MAGVLMGGFSGVVIGYFTAALMFISSERRNRD